MHLGIDSFCDFGGFFAIKLGSNINRQSIQKGIEKRCKKEGQRDYHKSRNKTLQPRDPERVLGPGEVLPFKAGQPLGGATLSPLASKVL